MLETFALGGLFIAGLYACHVLARRTGDPFVTRTVAVAYALRTLLAVALYYSSLWGLPVWRGLQLGDGFWSFAPDAVYFHRYAAAASAALSGGLDPPPASLFGSPEYPLLVTAIYGSLGVHPLFMVWLNIAVACCTVLPAYWFAQELWGRLPARAVAALIAFWPSSVVWATQLLKDTIEVFLIVAFVWAFHRCVAVSHRDGGIRSGTTEKIAAVALALVSLIMAVRLRFYIGLLALVAASAALTVYAAAALWERRFRRACGGCALAAAPVAGVWATTWMPGEPFARNEAENVERVAVHLASTGDVETAAWLRQYVVAELARRRDESSATVASASSSAEPAGPTLFGYLSFSYLAAARRGYFNYSGAVLGRANDLPRDLLGLIRFIPRALANTFLSPNPWTPFDEESLPGYSWARPWSRRCW